ncbi:hypothetical protein QL285_002060 [Trifolium repens]|nr:hypothetical protein QL285_002060 [Trifolium repens]
MFVKKVSANALRDFHGKRKRTTSTRRTNFSNILIPNSSNEVQTNNSPDRPLKNAEVKRPRLEVSSSPVQILGNNQPCSLGGGNEMWTSFNTKINSSGDGDATSIWDDRFPLGDLIDKHFIKERFPGKGEELELERVLQTSLTDSVRSNFRLRVLVQKFGDMVKKTKTFVVEVSELQKKLSENDKNHVGKINELKNKLSEYEKNMAEITSLKNEINKLKKTLVELSLEKRRLVGREKYWMEENSNIKTKLSIKEDARKLIVGKLKAEIEKLKCENSRQYKAGYDKAVNEVVSFTAGLNLDGVE